MSFDDRASQLGSGLLSDREIVERLLAGDEQRRLIVTPLINTDLQLGPSSLDVRLGSDFRVIETLNTSHLDLASDPTDQDIQSHRYAARHRVDAQSVEPFCIHPGEFVLASTLEFVRLPIDLAARIEGRSSFGRLGLLVHATAGFVDPGFAGTLTFELYNAGKLPILLYAGLRVAQLCFYNCVGVLGAYEEKPSAKYHAALGTMASRHFRDPEVERLFRHKSGKTQVRQD